MSSVAVKATPKVRARRTAPAQFRDACERLAATPDGPVEFRSVRAMNEHIEANAEPLTSESPCQCGEAKQWKHKYCDSCAARIRRAKHKLHERSRRKTARAFSSP